MEKIFNFSRKALKTEYYRGIEPRFMKLIP
jgi:hypothetical protein